MPGEVGGDYGTVAKIAQQSITTIDSLERLKGQLRNHAAQIQANIRGFGAELPTRFENWAAALDQVSKNLDETKAQLQAMYNAAIRARDQGNAGGV